MKKAPHFTLGILAMAMSSAVYAEPDMLPAVTVTSTTIDDRFDAKRGEPSNVSHISGKKVDETHGKNILQVLEGVPGVTAELQSGDSLKITLRGIENQRYMGEKPGVAIVIDGVPVMERTGRVNIDLDNIESIRVIKGGASYLFGEDALSGAVVITTKRGAKMAGLSAGVETGSFGYQKQVMSAGFAKGDWVGHVQASHTAARDFYDQGNYLRNYVNGKLQYAIDATSDISFGFEQSKRNKDSHGTVRGVENAYLDPRSASGLSGKDFSRLYDVGLGKMNLNYAKDLGANGNVMVGVYQYADHTNFKSNGTTGFLRDANGVLLSPTNISQDPNAYINSNDNNQIQKGLKAEWRKGGEVLGWMAGLDLRRDQDHQVVANAISYSARSTAIGGANPLNRAGTITINDLLQTTTQAVYGELKWQATQPLTLTFNARYDDLLTQYSSAMPAVAGKLMSGQKNFNVWSERIGANYALSDSHEIYSNISTGFRTPTPTQLYGSTISPTGVGVVQGNPNLQPEQSLNQEFGLRSKGTWFGVGMDMDVALFLLERKNFILNTGGQYQTAPTGVVEQFQNIGGVRNRGVELALKTDRKETLSADLAYTYLDARFTRNDSYWMAMGSRLNPQPSVLYNNTGNIVPRTPKHKINLNTRYRYSAALSFNAEIGMQSGLYADETNLIWIGGRTTTNLMATYDLKTQDGAKWSFFARADNVFNRFYYTTIRGSSDSNGDGVYNALDPSIVVNPGRVLTAGLTVKF